MVTTTFSCGSRDTSEVSIEKAGAAPEGLTHRRPKSRGREDTFLSDIVFRCGSKDEFSE